MLLPNQINMVCLLVLIYLPLSCCTGPSVSTSAPTSLPIINAMIVIMGPIIVHNIATVPRSGQAEH